jgi:membrane-associated phospholipid phosphatase
MTNWLRLRTSEWILVSFFAYIAIVSHWFPARPNLHHQPAIILAGVSTLLLIVARMEQGSAASGPSIIRDFLPVLLTLLAFREMEYFLPVQFDHHLENIWIGWDRTLLDGLHFRAAIEKLGSALPYYLEFCYLLVYVLPFYCIGVLYAESMRTGVDRFLVVYLAGTLAAYALFPFFPSQPPRLVFPNLDSPRIDTVLRHLNLAILSKATIHVGVFPSAHVSSVFSAAWGMFLVLPRKKVFGWTLLLYAVSVSIATIYGRYHYSADVLAGFAVSLGSGAVAILIQASRLSSEAQGTLRKVRAPVS